MWKKIDYTKSISDGDELKIRRLYIDLFGKIPDIYGYNFSNYLDLSQLNKEFFTNLFTDNIDIIEEEWLSIDSTSVIDSDSDENQSSKDFVIICNKLIIRVSTNGIVFLYDKNEKDIKKDCVWLINNLPKNKEEPKEATIKFVCYADGQYYTTESRIRKISLDIKDNYNDDFIPVNEDVVKFLDQRESGLVILHGKRGTGKTNYIRSLCSSHPHNYIIITNEIAKYLVDPIFITFLINQKNSVLILEDCEEVLMDRGINKFGNAISGILNLSDGLMSDALNIKLICTFNTDVNNIDSALFRPGRCFAKYEFKELAKEKVDILNKKYDLNIKDIKPMTLAEIYNYGSSNYDDWQYQNNKIGY